MSFWVEMLWAVGFCGQAAAKFILKRHWLEAEILPYVLRYFGVDAPGSSGLLWKYGTVSYERYCWSFCMFGDDRLRHHYVLLSWELMMFVRKVQRCRFGLTTLLSSFLT